MRFSDFIWLAVIVIAVLLVRWYQTGRAPWVWTAVLAFVLSGLLSIAPDARAQSGCMPVPVAIVMLEIEAERIGGKVEIVSGPAVASFLKVINQVPPVSGPAETILILVHPQFQVALVGLVHRDIVCERYTIDADLLRKARGNPA